MKKYNFDFHRNPYYTDAEVKAAAAAIREATSWEYVIAECDIIFGAAGIPWNDIIAEYGADDGDGPLFEDAINAASDFLDVDI